MKTALLLAILVGSTVVESADAQTLVATGAVIGGQTPDCYKCRPPDAEPPLCELTNVGPVEDPPQPGFDCFEWATVCWTSEDCFYLATDMLSSTGRLVSQRSRENVGRLVGIAEAFTGKPDAASANRLGMISRRSCDGAIIKRTFIEADAARLRHDSQKIVL